MILENIKRDLSFGRENISGLSSAMQMGENIGYNQAIDDLASKGLLKTWHTIDTAPKDKREVDLWVVPVNGSEPFRAERFTWETKINGYCKRTDYKEPLEDYFIAGVVIPTHWMEIPEGPEVQS